MSHPDLNLHGASALTRRFVRRELDVATFGHLEHVHVAYDLLCCLDYVDATALYAKEIRQLTVSAGAPEKFNLTVTVAYLSVIAERIEGRERFEQFIQRNTDLMQKGLLYRWYSHARLNSKQAREQFLLPDIVA